MTRLIIAAFATFAALTATCRETAIYNGRLTSPLNAAGFAVTNLPTPVAAGDAVPKSYVDGIGGLTPSVATNISAAVVRRDVPAWARLPSPPAAMPENGLVYTNATVRTKDGTKTFGASDFGAATLADATNAASAVVQRDVPSWARDPNPPPTDLITDGTNTISANLTFERFVKGPGIGKWMANDLELQWIDDEWGGKWCNENNGLYVSDEDGTPHFWNIEGELNVPVSYDRTTVTQGYSVSYVSPRTVTKLATTNDLTSIPALPTGLVTTNADGEVGFKKITLSPNRYWSGEIIQSVTGGDGEGDPPQMSSTILMTGFGNDVRIRTRRYDEENLPTIDVVNGQIEAWVRIGGSYLGGTLEVGGTNVTDAIAAVGPQVKSEVLDEVEANYTRKGYSWVRPDDWTLDYSMSNTTASAVRAFAETDDSYRVISNVETVVSSAHEGNVFMRFLDPNTEKKYDVDAYFAVDAGITVNTNTGAFATAQDGLFRVGATRGGELRYVDVASQIMTKPSTNTVSWYANDVAGSERKAVNDAALEILTNAPLIGSNTYVEISGSVTNVYPYAIYRTFKPLMTRTGAGNIAAFAVSQHVLASAAHYADGHRSYSPQQFDDGAGNVATLVKLAWVNLADWARQNGHTEAEIAAAEIEDIALIRCSKATAVPDACIPYFMNELAAQRIFGASMRGVCGWTHCQELTNAVPVVMEDLRTMRFSPWYYDKYHDPVTGMEGFSRAEVCARLAEMGLQYRIHSGDSGKPVWVSVDNRPIILTTWAYGRVKSAYGASYVKGYYIIKHFVEDYGDTLKGIEQ